MKKLLKSLILVAILGMLSVGSIFAFVYQRNMKYNASLEKEFPAQIVDYNTPPSDDHFKCIDEYGTNFWSIVPCEHLKPTPTSKPVTTVSTTYKTTPKQAPTKRLCYDPDGNVVDDSKCAVLWATENQPTPTQQPTTNYDYYVPAYNYEPSNFEVPPPPKYETYVPNYPSTTIESEPFPSLGPSYNPNENCETHTTNAGSITVCK